MVASFGFESTLWYEGIEIDFSSGQRLAFENMSGASTRALASDPLRSPLVLIGRDLLDHTGHPLLLPAHPLRR